MADKPTPIMPGNRIAFTYVNWRGERAERRARVEGLFWGATEWHPEPGWLLHAIDEARGEARMFALKDMTDVRRLEIAAGSRSCPARP